MIYSCAYYQEFFILWSLWDNCPFELWNFMKYTKERECKSKSETIGVELLDMIKFCRLLGHDSLHITRIFSSTEFVGWMPLWNLPLKQVVIVIVTVTPQTILPLSYLKPCRIPYVVVHNDRKFLSSNFCWSHLPLNIEIFKYKWNNTFQIIYELIGNHMV